MSSYTKVFNLEGNLVCKYFIFKVMFLFEYNNQFTVL